MDNNTTLLLVVAGVAVGGYLLYKESQKSKQAQQNPNSRNPNTKEPNTALEYVNAGIAVIDRVQDAYGGW